MAEWFVYCVRMPHSPYVNVRYTRWVFWAVVTAWWVSIYVRSGDAAGFDWSEAVRGTGRLAWGLLLFTIFISLLHKLFPRVFLFDTLLPLRKHAGIFAFLLILSHAVGLFIRSGILGNVGAMVGFAFSASQAISFGSYAFLILLPVFLTSTAWAVRTMGYRSWKRLQRITHVAFVLAALHIMLLPNYSDWVEMMDPGVALGLYVLGYAFLFLRRTFAKRAAAAPRTTA